MNLGLVIYFRLDEKRATVNGNMSVNLYTKLKEEAGSFYLNFTSFIGYFRRYILVHQNIFLGFVKLVVDLFVKSLVNIHGILYF